MNVNEAIEKTNNAIDNNAIVIEQSKIIDSLIETACIGYNNQIKYRVDNIDLKTDDFVNVINYYKRKGFDVDTTAIDNGCFLLVRWDK